MTMEVRNLEELFSIEFRVGENAKKEDKKALSLSAGVYFSFPSFSVPLLLVLFLLFIPLCIYSLARCI